MLDSRSGTQVVFLTDGDLLLGWSGEEEVEKGRAVS